MLMAQPPQITGAGLIKGHEMADSVYKHTTKPVQMMAHYHGLDRVVLVVCRQVDCSIPK